jgi:hypothetical protein
LNGRGIRGARSMQALSAAPVLTESAPWRTPRSNAS